MSVQTVGQAPRPPPRAGADWLSEPVKGAPHGRLFWRLDSDKVGKEWTTPVTAEVRKAFEDFLCLFPGDGDGDAYLFPDPVNPDRPLTKDRAMKWLLRAEELAGVEHTPRRGWHGLRRRWATKRKEKSLKDVMYLGGWTDPKALTTLYQQPDADSLLEALNDDKVLTQRVE